jgi:hypothetical protein
MGLAYQSHGTPLSGGAGLGLEYLISKNSNRSYFGAAPNALSSSSIGLKGTEELLPGLSAVFNLQTSFVPTSGKLADGLASIVQNNGVPLNSQTSNADSSKDGQAFTTAAYAGLSSPIYGTLTYGRQNSLTLDGVLAYDPMSASGAFSVIGYQGTTAGMGDTENARLDNSFKMNCPSVTTRSPSLTPEVMMVRSPVVGPTSIGWTAAMLFSPTTRVNSPCGPRCTAVEGTAMTLRRLSSNSRALTNSPDHSRSSTSAKVALSRNWDVVWSMTLSTISSVPVLKAF